MEARSQLRHRPTFRKETLARTSQRGVHLYSRRVVGVRQTAKFWRFGIFPTNPSPETHISVSSHSGLGWKAPMHTQTEQTWRIPTAFWWIVAACFLAYSW